MTEPWLDQIKWNDEGLAPVITQEAATGQVLMLAWMNRESLHQTANRGLATYWSRSRQQLWCKGETSGNWQRVVAIRLDCDNDAILLQVEQQGGIACHTGRKHCFFQQLDDARQWQSVDEVLRDPADIYGGRQPD